MTVGLKNVIVIGGSYVGLVSLLKVLHGLEWLTDYRLL
jgi:hypothetical protein